MTTKYSVIKIDCVNFEASILSVHQEFRDALNFLHNSVNTEFNSDNWIKMQLDENNIVSIYELGYILKKSLRYRFMIRQYDDCVMQDF